MNPPSSAGGPPSTDDREHRLQTALEQLGPAWDEERLDEIPLDDDLVEEALVHLPSTSTARSGVQPTDGWPAFLLPTSGIFLIFLAVIGMGMQALPVDVGSLLAAGGFLLIVLAALSRGKRIERAKRRKRAEEILMLYGLDPDATRDDLYDQVERLRAAKQALEAARQARPTGA